jgi:threonine dehydratase
MDVAVRVFGRDVEDELRSLRDWLAVDDTYRGRVTLETSHRGPEDMGAVIDLLVVAVGSGGAATVLAGAIATWLRTRRSDVTVEIVESAHQRTVKVTAHGSRTPRR